MNYNRRDFIRLIPRRTFLLLIPREQVLVIPHYLLATYKVWGHKQKVSKGVRLSFQRVVRKLTGGTLDLGKAKEKPSQHFLLFSVL